MDTPTPKTVSVTEKFELGEEGQYKISIGLTLPGSMDVNELRPHAQSYAGQIKQAINDWLDANAPRQVSFIGRSD